MCLQVSENCKSLVLQEKCNIEIFLSPGICWKLLGTGNVPLVTIDSDLIIK